MSVRGGDQAVCGCTAEARTRAQPDGRRVVRVACSGRRELERCARWLADRLVRLPGPTKGKYVYARAPLTVHV